MYIYDSTNDGAINFDSVLFMLTRRSQDGCQGGRASQRRRVGRREDRLTGARTGQTAGMYFKVIDMAANLTQFRVYFTSLARANATYNALGRAGLARRSGELLNEVPVVDGGRLRAARGGHRRRGHVRRAGPELGRRPLGPTCAYILTTLGVEPDLLLIGNPVTDEFSTSSSR